MSRKLENREARRDVIRRVLVRVDTRSQRELAERLGEAGFDVTQSSLSRDLRDLGAFKVRGVYRLPEVDRVESAEAGRRSTRGGSGATPSKGVGSGVDTMERFRPVREIVPAGDHLIVIKTDVGAAQGVAVGIDSAGLRGVLGTVAGDDTIFVATASQSNRRIRKRFEEWRRESE